MDETVCGEVPGGKPNDKHVLRFENDAGDVVAQIVRRYSGPGVGESVLFALDAFGLVMNGDTHCITATGALSYVNSHHNWQDRAAVAIEGVRYELAMDFVLDGSGNSWTVDLTGTRDTNTVLEKVAMVRTGGPVGCRQCPAPMVVYISELMLDNASTLKDEAGEYAPWVEILNTDSSPVDLTGWSLSNDRGRRTLWTFPPITIPRNDFVVVFLDGESDEGPLHTSFSVSPGGGEIILTRADGVTDGGFRQEQTTPDESVVIDLSEGVYVPSSTPTPGELNPNMFE